MRMAAMSDLRTAPLQLYEKVIGKEETRQVVKFVLVGILNTAIGYGLFFVLSYFLNYLLAVVISHFIGVTNSYLWNKYWTFRTNQKNQLVEFVRFNAVYLVLLGTNLVLLWSLVNLLRFDPRIGQMIVLPITTMISFFGHKYWSFKKSRS
ncbi:MAG TPA: GtrA family protein [Methanocella sp.]|nr:GtrA family protein [Methanocella sp.]